MELSVALPTSGSWATPDHQVEVARTAERLGYRGLWTFQRLLYAGPPDDPFGGSRDGRWPSPYHSVLDPLVSLAFVAAHTTRARLGVAVVNGLFYSPVLLGKLLASLDVISGGRLDAGIGLGWSRAEYAASGVPRASRGARLDELLSCLEALFGDDPVTFAGQWYEVPTADVQPKPLQRPRPPLLLGGGSEAALRRVVRRADGWVSGSTAGLEAIAGSAKVLRRLAEDESRDPGSVRVVSRGVTRLRDEPGDQLLEGPLAKMAEDLDRLAAAGVDEVFLDPNFDPQVGSPDADPGQAMATSLAVMEGLAGWTSSTERGRGTMGGGAR